MRIIDCFTFFNEIDLLKIRLNELKDVVDQFVLVEATSTHSGKPKPLYFQENRENFDESENRINAFVLDDLPEMRHGDRWPLERYQREHIGDFLGQLNCQPDDIILVSDVDEIPCAARLEAVIEMVHKRRFAILVQKLYRFYLNNISQDDRNLSKWCGTVAFRYRELEQYSPESIRGRWCSGGQLYRHASSSRRRRCVQSAGWHLTSMGGDRAVLYKMQNYAHQTTYGEDIPHIEREVIDSCVTPQEPIGCCIDAESSCVCGCLWRGERQVYTPLYSETEFEVAQDLPVYVRDHKHQLSRLFRFADKKC